MAQELSIQQAAEKWGMSANWVRQLVKSGRIKARLNEDGPIAYYAIPANEPKPPSMRLAPLRINSPPKLKPESLQRREQRARAKTRAQGAPASKPKAKPKAKAKRKAPKAE